MRLIALLALLLSLTVTSAFAGQHVVKDPDGKAFAVVLDCSTCKKPAKGNKCESGVEDGFHDGARCGQCLLDANYGARIAYGYDLFFSGRLKDEKGKPLKEKFVRLRLANTWAVRTLTTKDGLFRMTLGATVARKSKKPLNIDLGDHVMRSDDKSNTYLFYMLPLDHKPCEAKK